MSGLRLPLLLHLCDSLFPTGGYAHSDGLEAATDGGRVVTGPDLRAWLTALLDETLARTEGPAVLRAWPAARRGDCDRLLPLDDELHALRPASASRHASRSVGTRLLRTWSRLYPSSSLAATALAVRPAWTLPVAFTIAAATTTAEGREASEAYMYTRLAAATSAAMRLMRIGQLEAHGLLAEALARVPAVTAAMTARDDAPSAFTPLADIAAMRQQYVTTRLFRS